MPVLVVFTKQADFKKILYLVRFMLFNVNENFFVDLLIQLNQINLQKASLCQTEDSPTYHTKNVSFLKQVETVAISPFNRTKVCTCASK